MIVSIKNDDGVTSYDVAKIEDENVRANANVIISKVSQLEVLLEALNFTSATHRGNLESLLKETLMRLLRQKKKRYKILKLILNN